MTSFAQSLLLKLAIAASLASFAALAAPPALTGHTLTAPKAVAAQPVKERVVIPPPAPLDAAAKAALFKQALQLYQGTGTPPPAPPLRLSPKTPFVAASKAGLTMNQAGYIKAADDYAVVGTDFSLGLVSLEIPKGPPNKVLLVDCSIDSGQTTGVMQFSVRIYSTGDWSTVLSTLSLQRGHLLATYLTTSGPNDAQLIVTISSADYTPSPTNLWWFYGCEISRVN